MRVKWGCFLRGAFVLSPRVGMLGVGGKREAGPPHPPPGPAGCDRVRGPAEGSLAPCA